MSFSKICAPLTLALSALISLPGHSQTLPLTHATPQQCQPLAAPTAPVGYSEARMNIFRDGKRISATLARPGNLPIQAVVLLLHGYTGTQDELPVRGGEGIFVRTARAFADQGIATVRFDFIGSGESDGAWADTTFSSQTADTRAVLEALAQVPGLDDVPVHLLGFSQGGLVALNSAASGLPIRSIVLWNPVLDPKQTFGRILSRTGLQSGITLAQGGDLSAPVPGTNLNAGFFAEIATANPIQTAAEFTQPILAISGSLDRIADKGEENANALKRLRRGSTTVVSVPGDHALGATRTTSVIDEVIACSVGYVAQRSGMIGGTTPLAPLQ